MSFTFRITWSIIGPSRPSRTGSLVRDGPRLSARRITIAPAAEVCRLAPEAERRTVGGLGDGELPFRRLDPVRAVGGGRDPDGERLCVPSVERHREQER